MHNYGNGQGYASKLWQNSQVIHKVKNLPPEIPIFTNGPDAIYILTGRHASMLPAKIYPDSRQRNDRYLSEINEMKEQIINKNGVIVFCDALSWRWYLPSEDEIKEHLPIYLITKETDGSIYKAED